MSPVRTLRRLFSGRRAASSDGVFVDHTRTYTQALVVVRCYYVALLFIAATSVVSWPRLLAAKSLDPLWSLLWLQWIPRPEQGVCLVLGLFGVGSFLAAFFPQTRWARVLAFLGIFGFVALVNSFGKIGHSRHLLVFTAFLLVFLPHGWDGENPSRALKRDFLLTIWGCQAAILLSYTMSGCGKLIYAVFQLTIGEPHAFLPTALARHIAEHLLGTNSRSILGGFFIEHYWLGWPLMLGMLYLEFFAIWAAFRPSIQRFWVCGLIGFHVGSVILMGILFAPNLLLLGLFFLTFPPPRRAAASMGNSWRRSLGDLPLLGFLRPPA